MLFEFKLNRANEAACLACERVTQEEEEEEKLIAEKSCENFLNRDK